MRARSRQDDVSGSRMRNGCGKGFCSVSKIVGKPLAGAESRLDEFSGKRGRKPRRLQKVLRGLRPLYRVCAATTQRKKRQSQKFVALRRGLRIRMNDVFPAKQRIVFELGEE